jgi:hypothetical protein
MKRVTLSLPYKTYDELHELARSIHRSYNVTDYIGYLIRQHLAAQLDDHVKCRHNAMMAERRAARIPKTRRWGIPAWPEQYCETCASPSACEDNGSCLYPMSTRQS